MAIHGERPETRQAILEAQEKETPGSGDFIPLVDSEDGDSLKKASFPAVVVGGGGLSAANNLSDLTNAADARENLGLEIGVDVPAYVKHNFGAATAPGVTDDSTDGYTAGSVWINTTASPNEAYRCTNAAEGAAVWLNTTLELGDLGGMAGVDDAPSDGSQYARKDGAWAIVEASGAGAVDPQIATGVAHTVTGAGFTVPITVVAFGATDKDSLRLAVDHRTTTGPGEWTRTSTISPTTLAAHDVQVTGLTQSTGYDYRAVALDALNPSVEVLGAIGSTTTLAISVDPPTLTITGEPSSVPETPTLAGGTFSVTGGSDTHLNTDWQILNSSSTVVWESLADATNKTSIVVPAGELTVSTEYTVKVRYRGTTYGASAYDTAVVTTLAQFYTGIGTQGAQGFGCNAYPGAAGDLTTLGLTALAGATDPASANYGNYQHSNGGISVFVPLFYYRIGSASSDRYATYGLNAIDVTSDFADETAANAAGYALHRAFKDGGGTKLGFFQDKYLASKDGTTSCKSVANGVPISLTTTATYTNSNGMTGCTGILADAVVLGRARGTGWHCQTVFQSAALALLATAHGQAATTTTYCAWYDSGLTTNFPKGCNNNALGDTNDGTISYTTAGDSGSANKPLTGSGTPFAKTTHNGQACGIADVNGCIYQEVMGITAPGANATDPAQVASGDVYTLKTSVAAASLTGGWNGANDAWGDATHLATLYDAQTGLLPWGSTTGAVYFGNGTNQVFDPATSGAGWLRTAAGIPKDNDATSAGGTNLYGNDYCYRYNRANLFVLSAGDWDDAANAGVFPRNWYDYRSVDSVNRGFRASAYGS